MAAFLSIPLLLLALFATGQKAIENYRLNRQADALRAEIVSLRDQNIQLQQQIEQARTDTAIETIAREQLGLVKPGDHPVVIVSASRVTSADQKAPEPAPAPRSIWQQWLDYFFG